MSDARLDRRRDRTRGCLLGLALGSALGLPLEDKPLSKRPAGDVHLAPGPDGTAPLSADAQLALFTAEGLIRAQVRAANKGICHPPSVVHQAYLRWLAIQGHHGEVAPIDGPRSGWLSSVPALARRRSPSKSTIEALRRGEVFGVARPPNDSKGNGALARVAPVGLVADDAYHLGLEVAALTHGHVTGYLAPAFLAAMIAGLRDGAPIEVAVARARASLEEHHYADFVLMALDRAAHAATEVRVGADPRAVVRTLGRGYTADEALQIALFCVYVARGVRDGLSLAVAHEGDTDATASVVGAILGAAGGEAALPADWLAVLELRPEIETLAVDLAAAPGADLESSAWWARYPGC